MMNSVFSNLLILFCSHYVENSCLNIVKEIKANTRSVKIQAYVGEQNDYSSQTLRKIKRKAKLLEVPGFHEYSLPTFARDVALPLDSKHLLYLPYKEIFSVFKPFFSVLKSKSNITPLAPSLDDLRLLRSWRKIRGRDNPFNRAFTKKNFLRGGNFRVFPRYKVVLMGTRKITPGEKAELETFFDQHDLTLRFVNLPNLGVGHLDEVFNIIESQKSCHFKVLVADPEKAFHILGKDNIEDFETYSFVRHAMSSIRSATFDLEQTLSSLDKDCKVDFYSIPVFWNAEALPERANAVNGLVLEGKYFYSLPYSIKEPNEKMFRALKSATESALQKVGFKDIIGIDTREYDRLRGNLHCATLN